MVADRDKRSLSRLDPRLKPADGACDELGRLFLSESPRAWSRNTIIGRMIEFGNLGAAQPGRPPTTIPERVVVADKCFATFSDQRKRVFMARFVYNRDLCREHQARRAGLSLEIFKSELRGILEAVCTGLDLLLQ